MKRLLTTCLTISGMLAASVAVAAPNDNGGILLKRGTYYIPDPGDVQHGVPSAIYLQRDGGNFGSGYVPPFEQGDDAWQELVECVKYQYAQFNITVTDSNPGGNYILASVGGSAEDIGGSGFCGIAPFSCNPMRSAVVYNHSECYPGNMEQLCFTVAQETAHALGLEHQMTCPDPLTYLSGCGFKEFRDEYGNCGEFSARSCDCGGTTQNTVQHLSFHLGTINDNTDPNLVVTSPQPNAYVSFGFPVNVNATDNRAMARVEVYLDGNLMAERRFPPYNFKAPNSLALGEHTMEFRAYDWAGNSTTLTRNIFTTVDGNPPECMTNGECANGEICYNLQCWPEDGDPPPAPGETGSPCAGNDDCTGGICATSGGESKCTETCTTADSCPTGFDCVDAGGTSICWPGGGNNNNGGGEDTGGCSVNPAGATSGIASLVLLLGALVFAGRRRRR